jgi:hypothetical protein
MRLASIGILITGVRKTAVIFCIGVTELSGPKMAVLTAQPKRSGNPKTYPAVSMILALTVCKGTRCPTSTRIRTAAVLAATAAVA